MSVPEEARKVLNQLQTQYQEAARQLSVIRQQTATRERDKKLNILTLREIEDLPRGIGGVTCYRGVGRMFMQESRNNVENTLKAKQKRVTEELTTLSQKAKYLEQEMILAQGSLRDVLRQNDMA